MIHSRCTVALVVIAISMLNLTLSGCRKPSFGDQLSSQQEIEIGRQASAQLESQNPIVADPTVTKPVDEISAKIIPIAKALRPDIDYHVRVLNSDDQDSFSLPGGWIYIDQGLVVKIGKDTDALACVIAHEAAHVVLRHSAKQLSDAYGTDALIDLLTEGKYEEAANISLQLAVLSHSHQDELDADRLGEKMAMQAGYDPEGFARFVAMISAEPSADVLWVETHPLPKSRIKKLNQDIESLRNTGKR